MNSICSLIDQLGETDERRFVADLRLRKDGNYCLTLKAVVRGPDDATVVADISSVVLIPELLSLGDAVNYIHDAVNGYDAMCSAMSLREADPGRFGPRE